MHNFFLCFKWILQYEFLLLCCTVIHFLWFTFGFAESNLYIVILTLLLKCIILSGEGSVS